MTANGYNIFILGDKNILKLDGVMVRQLCKYIKKSLNCIFEGLNSIVCELYLNKVVILKNLKIQIKFIWNNQDIWGVGREGEQQKALIYKISRLIINLQ